MNTYVLNKETQKIELHFDKANYTALTDDLKSKIKSTFLWSNRAKAWVSRSKNNHRRAIEVAKNLGLEDKGSIGERLSYSEELDKQTDKAAARADRFDTYADNAATRAKNLQSCLDHYRGDISFFTQPIIAGHAGSRAFSNYRNRLIAKFDKGFEEYKKSSYYQDRAATARSTANNDKLNDKVYLITRMKECKKSLKKYQSYIVKCEENIYSLGQGKKLIHYDKSPVTTESQEAAIERYLEKYDYEQGKFEFMEDHLNALGGVEFSESNIKKGYIVEVQRRGSCEVISTGPQNITYKILTGGAAGLGGKAPYAAITKIIKEA